MSNTYPRFIPIPNRQLKKLHGQIEEFRKKADPILKKYNKIEQVVKKGNEEMKGYIDELNALEQKANAVKEKMVPIVIDFIDGKLTEDEDFIGIELQKDVLVVKVENAVENYRKARKTRAEAQEKAKKEAEEQKKEQKA